MSPADTPNKKVTTTTTTSTNPVTPDNPPPLITQPISSDSDYTERRSPRFLTLILYFLMALAVAALVVLGGRWVYHKVKSNDVKPAPAGNSTPAEPTSSSTNTESGANNSSNSSNSTTKPSSGSSSSSSSSSGTSSQSTSGSTGQLPNNGPGDVVAIFLGTAAVVGGLHYVLSLRRG